MKKNKRKIYEGEVLKDYRELVDRYKTRYANNIAFEYKKEVHDKEHIKITYAEFARDIEALGSGLLTLDFINKRVAIISPNRYEWCTSYLAVGTAGLTVVPLDKSLPNNEIESLIVRSKVEAVIFDKKYAEVFNKIKQEETSNLKYYICMDNLEDFTKYGDILNKGKKLLDLCITEQNVINKKNNNLENSKENKNEVKDSKLKSKLDGELNNVNKYFAILFIFPSYTFFAFINKSELTGLYKQVCIISISSSGVAFVFVVYIELLSVSICLIQSSASTS